MLKEDTCEVCFQIKCQQCEWVASEEEAMNIQIGKLSACPRCGWKPNISKS